MYSLDKSLYLMSFSLKYPGCWQSECQTNSDDKEGFAALAQELSAAFKPNGWLLSAAVSASKRVIDVSYDIPKLG